MGVLIENGRKKSLSFNTATARGAQSNQVFAEQGVRFAVLGQAIRAYFSDLRSGKYVNTAVEIAIWGIILDEDPDLVDSMKPGLFDFLFDNFENMVPLADSVFNYDNETQKSQTSEEYKPKISENSQPETAEKSTLKINLSDDRQRRIFTALIAMLGKDNAHKALDLLSNNDLVMANIGVSQQKLKDRLSIALWWLTNVLENQPNWDDVLKLGRKVAFNEQARKSLKGGASFSISDVSDLIKDLKLYLKNNDSLSFLPRGAYINYLETFRENKTEHQSEIKRPPITEQKVATNPEIFLEYIRELDSHLSSIFWQALKIEDVLLADLLSLHLWPNSARSCGAKAGTELGLPPSDAAMLTALIVGQTYERVHQGIPATKEMKTTYEQHKRVAIFLNKELERLQSTSHPVKFLEIFMDEFDIKSLY